MPSYILKEIMIIQFYEIRKNIIFSYVHYQYQDSECLFIVLQNVKLIEHQKNCYSEKLLH